MKNKFIKRLRQFKSVIFTITTTASYSYLFFIMTALLPFTDHNVKDVTKFVSKNIMDYFLVLNVVVFIGSLLLSLYVIYLTFFDIDPTDI
jgi:hypothetical protein